MKVIDILNEAQSAAQRKTAKKKAANTGNFSKDVAFSIMGSLAKIIKKHAKGAGWEYNKTYLDQGLEYVGDDIDMANGVIDAIIGDMYGYFVDGPAKDRVKVKHSSRVAGDESQDVYSVMPMGKFKSPMGVKRDVPDSQLEFFKFKDKPALGVLFKNVR